MTDFVMRLDRRQLWKILRETGTYATTDGRPPLSRRFPTLATMNYYARLARIVVLHSRIARMGNYDLDIWADGSFELMAWAERVGGRVSISGMEGLYPEKPPVVFIANHMSMLDAFLLPAVLLSYGDVTFVIKESLLRYPVFGHVMRAVGPIAVSRKSPRDDLKTVLVEGERQLAEGRSIIVFPQATRNPVFDAGRFNSMGVKLARRAGVCAVPIALKTDFLGNGRLVRDFGPIDPRKTIHIGVGTPMRIAGNGQDAHDRIVAFIAAHLRQWGGTTRNPPACPPYGLVLRDDRPDCVYPRLSPSIPPSIPLTTERLPRPDEPKNTAPQKIAGVRK